MGVVCYITAVKCKIEPLDVSKSMFFWMTHPALVVHPLICPIICESSFITNIISLAILGSWEMFGLEDVIGNAGQLGSFTSTNFCGSPKTSCQLSLCFFFRIQIHVFCKS